MKTRSILLWLEAPLQSWGFDSKFSVRSTLDFPTKSGILGLLCCALGAGGEQRELLSIMAPMTIDILAFERKSQKGDRTINTPPIVDFQMVGAGYDKDDYEFGRWMIPITSDGKIPNTGGVKLTYRHYLQDKAFAVAMVVPEDLSEQFAFRLQNPVWDLYLGRKSCAPVDFIYRGVFENGALAVARGLEIAQEKSYLLSFKAIDGKHQGERIILNDVPVQFGPRKIYAQRYVTIIPEWT